MGSFSYDELLENKSVLGFERFCRYGGDVSRTAVDGRVKDWAPVGDWVGFNICERRLIRQKEMGQMITLFSAWLPSKFLLRPAFQRCLSATQDHVSPPGP